MKRELMTLAATVGLTLAANASPVGVYINDDFATLDTAVWNTAYTTGTIYVESSYVYVKAASSETCLSSKTALTPNSESQYVKATATNLGFNDQWPSDIMFGLSSNPGGAGEEAYLRIGKDVGWAVNAYVNGQHYAIQGLPGPSSIADFAIIWTPTKVQFMNGNTVWFDTSVNAPIGGGSWTIPSTAMKVYANTYVNSLTVSADAIKYEVVPEPAMASLLLLGAATFALRRRRN